MRVYTGWYVRAAGIFLFWGILSALPLAAAPGSSPAVSADLLWAGSWEAGGNLVNRGDLRLNIPGFVVRFQATDRRSTGEAALPLWEHVGEGLSALAGGIYHRSTGSRLLYGIIDEWGLSARLRGPWAKGPPWAENRDPLGGNLKTEPSSTREPEAYLYLASPRRGAFRTYATLQAGKDLSPSVGAGFEAGPSKTSVLRVEGFYTHRELAPHRPAAWFSPSPPLPERDFHLGGLGLFFSTPLFGVAADGAYSRTFAFGDGFYGNLALRLGDRPWRLSLTFEGAGDRFSGRDGEAPGGGFRGALRLERRNRGAELFRLDGVLRLSGTGEPDRLSALVSYRFPSTSRGGFLPRLGTIKAEAGRNQGTEPGRTLDTLEGSLGLILGPLRGTFDAALGAYAGEGDRGTYRFKSFQTSGELSYSGGLIQGRVKLGYTGTPGKGPVWTATLSGSIRRKPGRFSLSVSSPDFPRDWTWGVSWRLEGKMPVILK
jgi:hypothetical protein